MVQNYNVVTLGTGSRTTTGILVPSNVGGTGYIDSTNTDWIAFSLTITGTATVQVEVSFNNGASWDPVYTIRGSDSTTQANAQSSGLWFGNTIAALARLNVTAVAGTVTLNGGTTDVVNAPNGTPSSVVNTPVTATPFNLTSTASTNLTQIKGSAGTLYEIDCSNTSAAPVFLKIYAAPAASVVVGTTVPIMTVRLSASGNAGDTALYSFASTGKRFSSGISFALTGAVASTDATAVAAGILVSGSYL